MLYSKVLDIIRKHGFFGAKDAILTSKEYANARSDLMGAYLDITYMLRYGKFLMD